MLINNSEHNQKQEFNAILKILEQSKGCYNQGKHKTAKKAFSDIRKMIKRNGDLSN